MIEKLKYTILNKDEKLNQVSLNEIVLINKINEIIDHLNNNSCDCLNDKVSMQELSAKGSPLRNCHDERLKTINNYIKENTHNKNVKEMEELLKVKPIKIKEYDIED